MFSGCNLKHSVVSLPSTLLPGELNFMHEVSWESLRRRSLFVATPMYDAMCTLGFMQSMQALNNICWQHGLTVRFHPIGNESLVQRGRNYLADEFMRSGMTHLLFIDADIEFAPEAVLDLLALAGPQTDRDIVCGPYPKKAVTGEKIIAAFNRGLIKKPDDVEKFIGDFVFNVPGDTVDVKLNEEFEISEGGTGFMMIQRKALESFADRYPNAYYRPDHKRTKDFDGSRRIMAYFDCEIDRGTYTSDIWSLIVDVAAGKKDVRQRAQIAMKKYRNSSQRYFSEDYLFCRMARDAGCKVWMVPWINLAHHGRYAFHGGLNEMMQAGISPTLHQTEAVRGHAPSVPEVLVPFE